MISAAKTLDGTCPHEPRKFRGNPIPVVPWECRLPSPVPFDSAAFRSFPAREPRPTDLPRVRFLLRT